MDLHKLSEPFDPALVSWRVGSTSADKKRGLALAYIDARDVMARLDEVVGSANWQDRYEFPGKRTICYLSLRIDGEWVTKADGAGDSDVEAEKGAISDALKRAAVKWGIGRYLYDVEAPWVELEAAGRSYKIKDSEKRKLEAALRKGLPRREDRTDTVAVKDTPANEAGEAEYRTASNLKRTRGERLLESDSIIIRETLVEAMSFARNRPSLSQWLKGQQRQIDTLHDADFDAFWMAFKAYRDSLPEIQQEAA